jgi:hypothetical protein
MKNGFAKDEHARTRPSRSFMNKDLTIEAKQQGNSLIVEAKPAEKLA